MAFFVICFITEVKLIRAITLYLPASYPYERFDNHHDAALKAEQYCRENNLKEFHDGYLDRLVTVL